ncbi:MAG: sigma-70 family RNA polymerase sigma factor [Oscillospiraceae bacterium]|nr:sigma-70 family RNA polymerase sigma factor [Oscillospiraceae bacterium]
MKNTLFNLGGGPYLPREMQLQRLRRVIGRELTEIQRETLMAYYFEGCTLEQIALRRGVKKSTVWRTLKRAEQRLRRVLQY